MPYGKCLHHDTWNCRGERKKVDYEKPCPYFYWPDIYLCEAHKKCKVDYRVALNSLSNVKTNNREMTHTKDISELQGMEYWIGNIDEIVFCDACNGTGEIGDCKGNLSIAKPCDKCKCTGRKK